MTGAVQSQTFNKYRELGAYHYDHTIGSKTAKDYDPRLTARYVNAVTLLAPSAGDTVLDAGSGEGVAALLCCRRGAKVVALELDQEACRLGEQIRQEEGFSAADLYFTQESLYNIPFKDKSFDGVISLEVIEHMDNVDLYLSELRRVLKVGGKIVFSTPLRRPDGQLQDPYHVCEYSAESLEETLKAFFTRVQIFSAWSAQVARRYESNRPFSLVGKLRRRFHKWRGLAGRNLFCRVVPFEAGCPLLIASATKA